MALNGCISIQRLDPLEKPLIQKWHPVGLTGSENKY